MLAADELNHGKKDQRRRYLSGRSFYTFPVSFFIFFPPNMQFNGLIVNQISIISLTCIMFRIQVKRQEIGEFKQDVSLLEGKKQKLIELVRNLPSCWF